MEPLLKIIINNCEILSDAVISRENLSIEYRDSSILYSKPVKDSIDSIWKFTFSEKLNNNVNIFNGNLFSFKSLKLYKDKLHLLVENTNYKEYVATRQKKMNNNFPLSNPIAVCIALVTEDNYIIMEKRKNVDVDEGKYHVIGGFMDRDRELNFNPKPDPFYSIESEVFEEINTSIYNKVKTIIGVVYDHSTPHPEICFYYKTSKKLHEIQKDVENMKSSEVTSVFGVKSNSIKLVEYLRINLKSISTTGLGCLLLYGKYKFGNEWFIKVLKNI